MSKMRRRAVLPLLLLAACATMDEALVTSSRPAPIERVRVEDVTSGCFGGGDHGHELTRRGLELVSTRKRLHEARAQHLVELLLASRESPQDPLLALGITPESVRAQRAEIFEELRVGQPEAIRQDLRIVEERLTYDKVASTIRTQLSWSESTPETLFSQSTLERLFRVTLYRNGERFVVESRALLPWMLPWRVTVGDRSWLTYSPEVARALAEFVADDAPPGHLLLQGGAFWSRGLWHDQSSRQFWLGVALGKDALPLTNTLR